MPWNSAGDLSTRNFRKRGLAPAIAAGLVCQKVQESIGELGHVAWFRSGTICIEAPLAVHLVLKNQEQSLLHIASIEAEVHGLPKANRIRLTPYSID
jgi:hypothetical protein